MKKILLVLLCGLTLYSCKKDKKEDPAPVPVTTGNLQGKVTHYDQFGTTYTTSLNTTNVSIVNRNRATTTDANGHYTFAETSTGTFTLAFNNPGCGEKLLQAISYKYNDTTTYNATIADLPTFAITTAYVKDTSWFSGTLNGIYYNANTNPVSSKATLVAIIGKSPNLNINDPKSYFDFTAPSLINTVDYNRFISYSFLSQTYGFKKDSTIYVKLYPIATTGASYVDNVLNRPVYTAYGTPYATFTLTMP